MSTDPRGSANRRLDELQIVIDRMSIPVTRCSRDLTYLWVSKAYAEWLDRSPAEIAGRPIAEVIGQEAFERLRPHFERVLSGHAVRYEEEVRFQGRGPRWINAEYNPTFDAAGAADGWVAVVTDITDAKRAEPRQALQLAITQLLVGAVDADEALTGILKTVGEGLQCGTAAIWTLDREAQALRCTNFWRAPTAAVPHFEAATRERTLGRGVGLPGRVWASGRPAWIPDVVRDDNFPRAEAAARDGLHGAFAFPILLAGETVGVMEFFSRTIEEPDENLLALLKNIGVHTGQFLDRKRAEGALRQSEARKAAVLDTALDAVITIDQEGRVVEFNAAAERIFGYSREEAVGAVMAELIIPPALRESHTRGLARYLATGVGPVLNRRLELTAVRSDGTELPVEVAIRPLVHDGPALFTGYIRDITERKAAEEALKRADRRKDEFLATLAHELRNPLAPIRIAVDLLRMNDLPETKAQKARDIIDRQVQQMTRLIDDLLDVSRITRGKINLRRERINLASVVSDAVDASRPLIDTAGHELNVTVASEPIYVEADAARLAQVFSNLLSNAAKFTDKGGHIWLTAEQQGSEAVVAVRDTGIGIAAEHLAHIFDMFSQVAPALDRSHGGLGIGLALVQALVELHGGRVEARSAGPGLGSAFTVRLPLAADRVQPAERPDQDRETIASASAHRILVVDDNRDSTEMMSMMLQLAGHEVHTAHDGLEAVHAAASIRPDIVLLDIGLPKMNGYEAARYIRQQPWGRSMSLVAVTGWGQEEDKRRASEAGFDHHLTKPVDATALENVLARIGKRIVS